MRQFARIDAKEKVRVCGNIDYVWAVEEDGSSFHYTEMDYCDECYFTSCVATVPVAINGVIQNFRSGGLYGIHFCNDCSDEQNRLNEAYKREVEGEELDDLLGILGSIGIPLDHPSFGDTENWV